MNRKIFTSIFIATAIFFSSCQKDVDIFVPDPGQINGPDVNWVPVVTDSMPAGILRKNLLIEPGVDSFEVNANTATLLTSSGIQCIFPPHSCVAGSGTAVTGKVYVESMLIKKKGDMIRMGKPTTSNDKMLVSGGEVFLRVFQGTQELKLAQGIKVQVKIADTPTVTQMKLFFGDESVPDRFDWVPADTLLGQVNGIANNAYYFVSSKLHWINCDYFYSFNTSTQVKVVDSLPDNFTNANSISYLVFNNLRSVIRMNPETSIKKFVSSYLPSGLQATVIVISKQANDYYLGKETITTGVQTSTGVQNVRITPVKKSLADIKTYLSTL